MDWQLLFNAGGAIAIGSLGWFGRTMYDSIRELQRELASHKETVARDYVTTPELDRIENKLDRILDRLMKI